jgi:hypothetical protein
MPVLGRPATVGDGLIASDEAPVVAYTMAEAAS